MKKLALALTMLALPVTGFSASQEIEKCITEEQYALAECYGGEYDRQDKRLNIAYKAAIKSGNTDSKLLKQKQREWIKSRDKSCPKPDENIATGMAFPDWYQCLAEKTEIRAIELEKIGGK